MHESLPTTKTVSEKRKKIVNGKVCTDFSEKVPSKVCELGCACLADINITCVKSKYDRLIKVNSHKNNTLMHKTYYD